MAKEKERCDVMTFKADKSFREHLEKKAKDNKLKVGTYLKVILKKHTGYKERELV